jgi:hypothetical protein
MEQYQRRPAGRPIYQNMNIDITDAEEHGSKIP